MEFSTNLDEIILYKNTVQRAIGMDDNILAFLSDDPNIKAGSPKASEILFKNILDHSFCDDTIQVDTALILVEVEMYSRPTDAVKNMTLNVQVICNNNFIELNKKKFKGVIGNRRDNIARYIDAALHTQAALQMGIGRLQLYSCMPTVGPSGFSSIMLSYRIPEFARRMK